MVGESVRSVAQATDGGDGPVAQAGEVDGGMPYAGAVCVFGESGVSSPMDVVFDGPVQPTGLSHICR